MLALSHQDGLLPDSNYLVAIQMLGTQVAVVSQLQLLEKHRPDLWGVIYISLLVF